MDILNYLERSANNKHNNSQVMDFERTLDFKNGL